MFLTLDKVKRHLNIDLEFIDDDCYIGALIETAESLIERHIGYSLADLATENDGVLPLPIQHAALLLIGTMYSNRESVVYGTPSVVPHAYDYIISLYENYNKLG